MAGAKWTGAKITFDEDEAQPEAAGGRAAAQDTVSPKEENRSLPAAQLPASLQAVKWRKLVTAELQQVKHGRNLVHVFTVMCENVRWQPQLSAAQPSNVLGATALA